MILLGAMNVILCCEPSPPKFTEFTMILFMKWISLLASLFNSEVMHVVYSCG